MTVYLICYAASFLLSVSGHDTASGLGLIAAACWLYLEDRKKRRDPLTLRGLFALSFVGGEGLALLKLSRVSGVWTAQAWLSFLLAFVVFWAVYELVTRRKERESIPGTDAASCGHFGIFLSIAGLSAVVFLAFVFEAAVLGYIPFFVRGVPHAYAAFHVKGVHYFTVSAVLLPAMAVIWFLTEKRRRLLWDLPVALSAGMGFLIPILCASRSQMLFSILLTVLVYAGMSGKQLSPMWVGAAGVLCAGLFALLTVVRGHDSAYLNAVFEMKNADTPVFISQPYMYIINNYENFNFLTRHLRFHTMGAKGLFPLWTFTGLKNRYWFLTCWGNMYVKAELTTTTIIYDAWYDFGLPGVCAFQAALAAAAAQVGRAAVHGRNPFIYLLYGQFALYMILSFFTTWFSLPITWFYFGVTGIAMAMVYLLDKGAGKKLIGRFRRKKQ
ncbi:MAG: oligosaccharide repeat unit polymerase [Clostridium sp.]|nr:oligosaccharide repeat unit polymerase [Clostridium sp.]